MAGSHHAYLVVDFRRMSYNVSSSFIGY